jgi:hypothetical protein
VGGMKKLLHLTLAFLVLAIIVALKKREGLA